MPAVDLEQLGTVEVADAARAIVGETGAVFEPVGISRQCRVGTAVLGQHPEAAGLIADLVEFLPFELPRLVLLFGRDRAGFPAEVAAAIAALGSCAVRTPAE